MEDVHNLWHAFQFPDEFRRLGWMAKGAMFRTSVYENSKQSGLHITARDHKLRQAYRHTTFFERTRQWALDTKGRW